MWPLLYILTDLAGDGVGRSREKSLCKMSGSWTGVSGRGLRWKEVYLINLKKAAVFRTQKRRGERYEGAKSSRTVLRIVAFIQTAMKGH